MTKRSIGPTNEEIVHAIKETKKLADKLRKKQKDKEAKEDMPIPNIIIGDRVRHAPKPAMSPFE